MAYKEPEDLLLGKAKRHSRSASISQVLGLGKSIIIDESPSRINMVGTGKIVYQNNDINLTVHDIDVIKVYNKLENIDETTRNIEWDKVGDDVLISLGFGDKNITPLSKIGAKSYSDFIYSIMNFFESERAKNRGEIVEIPEPDKKIQKPIQSPEKAPTKSFRWELLDINKNEIRFNNISFAGRNIDIIETAWGNSKRKSMLWVNKTEYPRGKTGYQVNLYYRNSAVTLAQFDSGNKAYEYAERYLRTHP